MDFFAKTGYSPPGLHIWRPWTNVRRFVAPISDTPDANGWFRFECELDASIDADVQFKLYQRNDDDSPSDSWEAREFNRTLPRGDAGELPGQVWFIQGSSRVLTDDPMANSSDEVRIHLITAGRYRDGKLYVWSPDDERTDTLDLQGHDDVGPYWDITLTGRRRHVFNFKFLRSNDGKDRYEPDFANRIYSSSDGGEIWTHSEGVDVISRKPQKKTLSVHFKDEGGVIQPAKMHLWQPASDFATDVLGEPADRGWARHQFTIYTGIPYRFKFRNETDGGASDWEHDEATRTVRLAEAREFWTLEGDGHLFDAEPQRNATVTIKVSHRPPTSGLGDDLYAHVWVNRARWPLREAVAADPSDSNKFTFKTYPQVTTSLRFTDGQRWEDCGRHTVRLADETMHLERHVVLGRPPALKQPSPVTDLFSDPPFWIIRPGAYEENGQLRFVLHSPQAARARLAADWTDGPGQAVEMRSTRNGTYWWASIPVADVGSGLPAEAGSDYHGAKYKFLLDDGREVQDPAAGWVERSSTHGYSRLVRQSHFDWHDASWRTPTWDYLAVYQIHPKRFTNRFPESPSLIQVAKEIDESSGYLSDLGVTAILLMPVNEVGSNNSWGYDPAYFYAVERDYGGPDALKHLVDTCHRHGLAVLLDVVFNHAGSDDNILWQVARHSYFDGDTRWGAMINFDHPQCRHFFEQNLVYWNQEFHIDGFRLDHTHTIVHSHYHGGFIREPGSGGGWQFLHGLRHALHEKDARAILTAEHLPNEWPLTNYGGPMDSQWCDDFHDRLVDACRGYHVMPRLADAMKLSHTHCQQWYNVTNYPESHDEVGNVNDRIANVAGFGRGLRMSKVAAAASVLARGIPMFFMGAESGEYRQFRFGSDEVLNLTGYQQSDQLTKVRAWWKSLLGTRRGDAVKGPATIEVRYADDQILAFSRGLGDDYFVVLNFGGWSGSKSLAAMNLPDRTYRELWNSTWPAFAVEQENEHTNGGRNARLTRGHSLRVPDYGAVVLERA